jgi:hypothetical protein
VIAVAADRAPFQHLLVKFDIWTEFCLGSERAKADCRAFLRSRVVNLKQKFVVRGPKEYVYRRTLNTACAVEQMSNKIWRNLIAHVNSKVLLEKRRADPNNQEL